MNSSEFSVSRERTFLISALTLKIRSHDSFLFVKLWHMPSIVRPLSNSSWETLRVLPRARSNAPASYKQALAQLSHCIAGLFDRYFDMPEVENWHGKLNFYAQLADLNYADSLRRHNGITEDRVREAQALCREYLSFHLPERIPARQI